MSEETQVLKSPRSTSRIYRVALTGGPCAGKTSSLALISDYFQSIGWRVFISREIATIVLGGGVCVAELNDQQVYSLQRSIARTMISVEDTYAEIASGYKDDKNTLILCDRGLPDASVYCSKEIWDSILKDLNLNSADAKENRYDCVIHLVTAADGASEYYTCDNNITRLETKDVAIEVDRKTQKAWLGHPYLHVIDNSTSFKEKVVRGLTCICQRLGTTVPAQTILKQKYLFQSHERTQREFITSEESLIKQFTSLLPELTEFHSTECEYFFLPSKDSYQRRLRKRNITPNSFTYTMTQRSVTLSKDGEYYERKQKLTRQEYKLLKKLRLPEFSRVKLRKLCFVLNGQYFELSIYSEPMKGLCLLETYTEQNSDPLSKIPPTLCSNLTDVTNDKAYSMFNMAKIDLKK